jgi:hypothetical protein
MDRTDDNLHEWADEHLLYEAQMLAYTTARLRGHQIANPERNMLIESFAIHARCLREFLWHGRSSKPRRRASRGLLQAGSLGGDAGKHPSGRRGGA